MAGQHRRTGLAALSVFLSAVSPAEKKRQAHARVHPARVRGKICRGTRGLQQPEPGARGDGAFPAGRQAAGVRQILAGVTRASRWARQAADAGADGRGENRNQSGIRGLRPSSLTTV